MQTKYKKTKLLQQIQIIFILQIILCNYVYHFYSNVFFIIQELQTLPAVLFHHIRSQEVFLGK